MKRRKMVKRSEKEGYTSPAVEKSVERLSPVKCQF